MFMARAPPAPPPSRPPSSSHLPGRAGGSVRGRERAACGVGAACCDLPQASLPSPSQQSRCEDGGRGGGGEPCSLWRLTSALKLLLTAGPSRGGTDARASAPLRALVRFWLVLFIAIVAARPMADCPLKCQGGGVKGLVWSRACGL